jgi:hypothetical protein
VGEDEKRLKKLIKDAAAKQPVKPGLGKIRQRLRGDSPKTSDRKRGDPPAKGGKKKA